MKNQILRNLIFVLSVLFVFNISDAYSQSVVKRIKENPVSGIKFKEKSNADRFSVKDQGKGYAKPEKTKQSPRKASSEEVTLTIVLDYEDDDEYDFYPNDIVIYNNEYTVMLDEDDLEEIVLPAGEYDIMATFWNFDNYGLYIVIREQVSIEEDMEITLSIAEAKNEINIETYNPDGELCLVPVGTASGNTLYLEGGNVQDILMNRMLFLEGYGPVQEFIGTWLYREEEEDTKNEYDYYISDLSDRYLLTQTRITIGNDASYYVNKYRVKGASESMVLKNDPKDFVLLEQDFQTTPAGKNSKSRRTGFFADIFWKGEIMFDWYGDNEDAKMEEGETVKIYLDNALSEMTDEDGVDILFAATFIENYNNSRKPPIITLPAVLTADRKVQLLNNGHANYGNYVFQVTPEGDITYLPAHPAFCFLTEENPQMLNGDNVPVMSFGAQNSRTSEGGTSTWIDIVYIGRYGEIRMTDYDDLKISVKFNEEEVWKGNYWGLIGFTTNWSAEEHPDGVFDFTIVNQNIEVDGIAGKNITYVSYDQRKEDWTAPTLQMLQIRNTEGVRTDKFKTASEGIIEFAGADFNFQNVFPWNFDTQEMNATVYYSAMDEDDWTEIEVEEVPDLFRYTTFGYFYRGSLASVTKESSNGWFDLKIVCEDTSGNTQTQIISPAFKVEELLNSIATEKAVTENKIYVKDNVVYIDGDFDTADIYAVSGQKVTTLDGSTNHFNMQEMNSGVYIVKVHGKTSSSSHKISIH